MLTVCRSAYTGEMITVNNTLEATAQILEDAIAAEPVTDPANPEAEPTPGEIPADVEPAGAEIEHAGAGRLLCGD